MSTETQGADGTSSEVQEIDYDDCFDLLSNHRRRFTLHYMKQSDGNVKLGELSEQIAAWENDVDKDNVTYDQRKRVYTSLQQVHLPRMDNMGVIEFDDRQGVATLSDSAEELDIYLEAVEGRDVPWSAFYLLLVVVNAGFVSAGVLGVPGLAGVPNFGWVVFVLTTFFVVSLGHLYVTRTEMRLGEQETPPEISE